MGGIKLGLSVLEKISNLKSSSNGIYSDRFDGMMCIQKETCLLICISQRPLSIYSSHGQLKVDPGRAPGSRQLEVKHYVTHCILPPEAVHKACGTHTRAV